MLVFSQILGLRVNPADLLGATRRYFDAELEVLGEAQAPGAHALHLRLTAPSHTGEFIVRARHATREDLERARQAEINGRAAGMASLAERCPTIWVIEERAPRSDAALFNLCAILASVALGPVLPDDSSTLFGVRGALERVAKSRKIH
ncbi:MAG TPA: hypothetical protein VGI10_13425 [Polyangiaceae bacterium]